MNDNRRKLVGILRLLYDQTDSEHSLDTYQIIDGLDSMGYGRPDRKTVDSNIKFIIEDIGFGVHKEKGKPNRYKWSDKYFDISELKMIADALTASRYIPRRKSRELIAKLKDLTSVHRAASLSHELYVSDNHKKDNNSALMALDAVNRAINSRQRIRFRMFDYDVNKEEIICCDGKLLEVSPYALVLNNDICYMVGMPAGEWEICFYRVDRMTDIEDVYTAAIPAPLDFDIHRYSNRVFDIFDDETREVILTCRNTAMSDLIDRFGEDFYSEPLSDDRFTARIVTDTGKAFFAWVFGRGGDVRIAEPADLRAEYERMLMEQLAGA